MFHVTPRLLLRPVWPEDWEGIYAGIADEGVVRNLASAPWPYREHDAQAFATMEQDPREPTFLVTLPKKQGGADIVGTIGIDAKPDEGDGTVELGYWIARDYWGRGFATEATLGVTEIARLLGYSTLEASHYLDNPASGRVLRKAGFQPTGRIERRYSAGRKCEVDAAVYELDLAGECDPSMPFAA